VVVLGPFLAKPFNMDDPLFLMAARHIQAHPADPYGFKVEWGWREFPMWRVTENPPLACYYLALAAIFAGWSELGLHTAMLVPALAAVLGTYRLARNFCDHPMLAALAALSTPVFLVSGLTVMCDLTMLAFWIWAVIYWVEGTGQNRLGKLLLAGGLITLGELSKYYGVALVPLLAAYSVAARRPAGKWAPCLLTPLAALVIYHYATKALYGNSLLIGMVGDAKTLKNVAGFSQAQSALTTLVFAGGCAAAATIFAPLLWRVRTLAAWFGAVLLVTLILTHGGAIWKNYHLVAEGTRTVIGLQMAVWMTGGLLLLALAFMDLWRHRDAPAVLLAFWVLGTLAFVACLNWTVNARTLLPLTPPMGILIVRRLELRGVFQGAHWPRGVWICLGVSLTLAMMVEQGDYLMAVAVRQNARQVCADYKNRLENLWFEGHWGFQYYMSAAGAQPLDFKNSPLQPGNLIAVPSNNTNILPLTSEKANLMETYALPGPWLVTTCRQENGAGFYSSIFGILPFAFGHVPPETVSVYVLK
jgi:hypothetical protein